MKVSCLISWPISVLYEVKCFLCPVVNFKETVCICHITVMVVRVGVVLLKEMLCSLNASCIFSPVLQASLYFYAFIHFFFLPHKCCDKSSDFKNWSEESNFTTCRRYSLVTMTVLENIATKHPQSAYKDSPAGQFQGTGLSISEKTIAITTCSILLQMTTIERFSLLQIKEELRTGQRPVSILEVQSQS